MRIPVGGGFAGRIAAGRRPIYIADVDHAEILNPILRMKGVRSLLGVPLLVEGATLGVLHVGTVTPREFTNADAALLQLAAAQAAPAIDRARLFDALDREHRSAVALQRSLLPDRLPDLVGIDTAARYLPARDEVGGDWYDVIDLPGGHVGIAIGDVAGHGLRAASLMGQLRAGLRAYALDGHSPGDTLKRLDRMLQTISGRGMATAAYAIVDPATGALTLRERGSPAPGHRPRRPRRTPAGDHGRPAAGQPALRLLPRGPGPARLQRHDPALHRRPHRAPPANRSRPASSACARWPPRPPAPSSSAGA